MSFNSNQAKATRQGTIQSSSAILDSAVDRLKQNSLSTTRTRASASTSPLSIKSNTVKFSASTKEADIIKAGAASIKVGNQTLYIGTQQVTSNNQNPIVASFTNGKRNWVRTDYETTGADGRGYGLFFGNNRLYALFTVDGTQGTASQDFRRASSTATQSWMRSYGQGGGAKVTVLATIDPSTGLLKNAVYLSSVLKSGKSNSFAVTKLSHNSAKNLVVNADAFFSPRKINGTAMKQTSSGKSPFQYTLEITPDLKTAVSAKAVGWSN